MLAFRSPVVTVMAGAHMRIVRRSNSGLRAALIVAMTVTSSVGSFGSAHAQQKQKSNVQRERCSQAATRAVSTPGSVYYAAPVRGHGGGGGGIAGAIIGAVVITAIAASIAQSNRNAAENKCLVAAGLRPNAEPSAVVASSGDKPKRSGASAGKSRRSTAAAAEEANDAVGAGAFRASGPNSFISGSIQSQR
jgi:hypothetical protein